MFDTPSYRATEIPKKYMQEKIEGFPSAVEEWLVTQCGRPTTADQYKMRTTNGSSLSKQHYLDNIDKWERCTLEVLGTSRREKLAQFKLAFSK
jgi:hypothetical protein